MISQLQERIGPESLAREALAEQVELFQGLGRMLNGSLHAHQRTPASEDEGRGVELSA